jgi:centromere-localized protein 2
MQLFGQTSNLPLAKPHTLTSVLPEMEAAVEDVEDEVRKLEEEADLLLEQMRGAVGGLSDLRYGRFANGQLREQVLEGLSRLENSCGK